MYIIVQSDRNNPIKSMAKIFLLQWHSRYGNTTPIMKLADYLDETGQSAMAFAIRAGLAPSTITRAMKGRKPDWTTMEKIREHSKGAVTPNDFLDSQEAGEAA